MNSLRIVDCLPAEKYNRTAKFKLKYDLNYAVKITAETLSRAESDFQQAQMYTELAQKAGYEQKRYLTAIERINFFKEIKVHTIRLLREELPLLPEIKALEGNRRCP